MSILVTGTAGSLRIDEHNRLWGMRVPAYPGSQWEEITVPGDAELLAQLAKLAPNVASVSPFFIGTYYLAKSLINILQQGDLSFVEAASLYDGLAVQKTIDAARKSHLEQTWVRL
jgi:predicted dehydrogenase